MTVEMQIKMSLLSARTKIHVEWLVVLPLQGGLGCSLITEVET